MTMEMGLFLGPKRGPEPDPQISLPSNCCRPSAWELSETNGLPGQSCCQQGLPTRASPGNPWCHQGFSWQPLGATRSFPRNPWCHEGVAGRIGPGNREKCAREIRRSPLLIRLR